MEKTLFLGRRRIEQAKVHTYWRTGKLIDAHLRAHQHRAAHYGTQVIEKLAGDLGIESRLLWRCLQFARSFKILSRGTESLPAQLSWSHYRVLMTVPAEADRRALMRRAEKAEWSAVELAEKIRLEVRAPSSSPSTDGVRGEAALPKLLLKRGQLYTYRLINPEAVGPGAKTLWIDLGFQARRRLPKAGALKENQIVESRKAGEGYAAVPSRRTEADLFTYQAQVERVVDGDTLLVNIDLGFNTGLRQYLRLRGIDCPELPTPEGRKAKTFVEKTLAASRRIVLTSSRSDKYDRYLADVFYEAGGGEKCLNQVLLDEGLAGRVG